MKNAVITGVFGQDGSFLCELLQAKGYEVYGVVKEKLSSNSQKIKDELIKKGEMPTIYEVNLQDYKQVEEIMKRIRPHEVYHLSASHVSSDGKRNGETIDDNLMFKQNVIATVNLLSACSKVSKETRILTAGSCLMFDATDTNRQNESTSFESGCLYGIGKITENRLVRYYREKGIFACTAILYNHESYRRSEDFVTKKIVKNMCMLKKDRTHKFSLGDINMRKDWGYAKDYVKGMYLMLQGDRPQDYILSSGELHSIREFIETCADILHIENWHNSIEMCENIASHKSKGQLYGDAGKIENDLGWKPEKKFREWIFEMIMKELE